MRLSVLRLGAGDLPNLLLKIELVPRYLSDFLPALGSQGENLNDAAVGSLDLASCLDDASELVIVENTVPWNLASGLLEALARLAIDDRLADAPVEESLCYLQGLVGGYRRAVDDLTDEPDDVASGHIVNRPSTPAIRDLAFQNAADLGRRSAASRHVA